MIKLRFILDQSKSCAILRMKKECYKVRASSVDLCIVNHSTFMYTKWHLNFDIDFSWTRRTDRRKCAYQKFSLILELITNIVINSFSSFWFIIGKKVRWELKHLISKHFRSQINNTSQNYTAQSYQYSPKCPKFCVNIFMIFL